MVALRPIVLNVSRTRATRLPEPTQKHAFTYARTAVSDAQTQHLRIKQEFRQGRSALPRLWRRMSSYTKTGPLAKTYSTQQHPGNQNVPNVLLEPIIHPIFEPTTGTFQYIVADPSSRATVIIDPVLDFDPCTSSVTTTSADALLSIIAKKDYKVQYILETHAHADHITAASYLQAQLSKTSTRPQRGIGNRIQQVQELFGRRYSVPRKEYSFAFDKFIEDNEILTVGAMQLRIVALPGHTPDHIGYSVATHIFCGDSLFAPDIGTARTDFPGGSAHDLWFSAQKLLSLPDDTKIWTGHDYPPLGREPVPCMTVKQHKKENRHVGGGRKREEFVEMRRMRDGELGAPRLLHQSLQVNVRGGRLPEGDEGGRRMLRVPLKLDEEVSW